jgi:hypothetical protein
MSQVILYTGAGQDQVNVQAVAPETSESIALGTGDTVTAGSTAPALGGTLASILGPFRAQSYAGQTASVIIDDSGDATSHPLASFQPDTYGYDLTGLAPAPIYFQLDPGSAVKILGGMGNDMFTVASPLSATGIKIEGGGGTNTLAGPPTANTWAITGQNSGSLDTIAFSNFQSLVGGATSDAFQFSPANASIGTINGGSGAATLDYSRYSTRVSVNLGDGTNGTATGVTGSVTGITALIGGSTIDTLNAGTVPNVALTGGLGTNRLSGTGAGDRVVESIASSYTLTNTRLTGTEASFSDSLSGIKVASLSARSAVSNDFTVSGWTGTGSLLAPAGTGTVTARKSAGFTLSDSSLSSTDGMTLGLSGISVADLTTSAASGGPSFIVDASAFSGVTNLTAGGTVNAILFGGSANGSTLSAAGSGDDVLIGGSGNDRLKDSGTGYNILIGGPGSDTITGNGHDILTSGTTSYDSNTSTSIAALDAILAVWSSSDAYLLRVSEISSGVGPGGSEAFNSSTCQSDDAANVVSDGGSSARNNWFIVNSKDKVTKKNNETETIV